MSPREVSNINSEFARHSCRPLTFERARIRTVKANTLIAFLIKYDSNTLIEAQNLKNCLRSLVAVINEFGLSSISLCKTNNFDDLPWSYILNQIKKHLQEIPINITICLDLVQTPEIERRQSLILENHASAHGGHKGVTKTYNRIRSRYCWKTMKKDIQNFIKTYRECQLKKLTRIKTRQPMITDTPGVAFDKISLDIMGSLPITSKDSQYILTMQDFLTKYSVAVPLKETTSLTIADAFTKEFICIYGTPRAILTDQGTNFLSALMRQLTKKFRIQLFKTTAYHPQSNASLERSHHVLTEYLKTQIDKETNWDEYIKLTMFSYNTSVHEGTRYSPYELVFGRIAPLPSSHPIIEENIESTYSDYITILFNKIRDLQIQARQNLIQAKERSKRYYDRKLNPQQLKKGTYVYLLKELRKGKFVDQYTGPHEIIEILPSNIKIRIGNQSRIVHIDKIKLSHNQPG